MMPQGGLIEKRQIVFQKIVSRVRVQHHFYRQTKLIDPLPVERDIDSLHKDVRESLVEGRDIDWEWY
jgi:hypothetical protein